MKRIGIKIPGNWIVHHNELYDEEPLLDTGKINSKFNDSEDILWLEELNFNSLSKYIVAVCKHNNMLSEEELNITKVLWNENKVKGDNINIDLGWYGGDAASGIYRLTIYRGDWDHCLHTYESKSTLEVAQHLNYCLENIPEVINNSTLKK
ncbi:MAG: hypothetical protein K8R54_09785 [Bacteroidales bacterium]|nr:hypothetical protein [Bacteroidales bacterium]